MVEVRPVAVERRQVFRGRLIRAGADLTVRAKPDAELGIRGQRGRWRKSDH